MDAGGAIGCGAILLHCVVWERRDRLMKVGSVRRWRRGDVYRLIMQRKGNGNGSVTRLGDVVS